MPPPTALRPPTPRCWAVLLAAGQGQRMQNNVPKQYLPLAGATVLERVLTTLLGHPMIDGAALVLAASDQRWPTLQPRLGSASDKPLWLCNGGADRQNSCAAGLAALAEHCDSNDWVLVHDAARACLHHDDITRLIDTLFNDPVGGLLAIPARDTIKRADSAGLISATLNRNELWHALTPQMFRHGVLRQALAEADTNDAIVTDEANAIELLGLAPRLIEGRRDNIKITHADDLALAEFILQRQAEQVS